MLDTIVSGAVSVFIEAVKCLAAPIGNKFSYLCNYRTNFDNLKQESKKLTEEKESVHNRVAAAKRNGEETEQKVQTWLNSVDGIIIEAGKIIEDEEKAKSHCFKGLFPNWKTRYQFSKNAEQKAKAIVKLQQEGKFDKVSYTTIPQERWIPTTKGYESFESRISTLRDIEKALRDPNVNMIGVYGMGGIGKTTLVKEIAMKAEKEKLFDEVVFAHVSQTPETRKIQGEIADMLGLEFREESERGRAKRLCERLSNKKILIILDNIWTDLDTDTIGIPLGDDNKGCKVLLTARSVDVLSTKMNCENNFQVGILNEEETWSLFQKMVGKDFENPELQSIAIDVANECGGLPIAIVTIARALRNKSTYEWQNALQELRNPSKRSFTGVQAKACSTIEMSYNQLEDGELRSTFLLCGLMPDNVYISDLLRYSVGLGILQSVNTIEEARNRMYTLLHKLKASCLLLQCETSEEFSMHDVVRDVALSIASRDQHVFRVSNDVGLIKWPSKDEQKNCKAIVLCRSNTSDELPEGLECPQLEVFFYRRYGYIRSFVKIPENFFAGLTELNVLVLTGFWLLSLPSSVHLLVNLRTLCLDQCELGDMAIIGELKTLEILSFRSSNIEELPKEICQLSCLKLLDLSSCAKLKVIPPNVISSLSQLEELYMGNTFIQWDNEGTNTQRRNASLQELKHLSHLTNLEIDIKDAKILPKGLFSSKLERYKISIGDQWYWWYYESYECTRILKLECNTNIFVEDIMQLKGIEVLYLDELPGVKNILCEVDKNGFPQLKHLHVQNNPHFLCIVESMEWVSHEAFPQLESLLLRNLINLEKIYHGQLAAKSFVKLNSIVVDNCNKLKNIFSFSIVKGLPQLQMIKVTGCKTMEEIFVVGREDDVNNNEVIDNIELGQLRFVTLKSLPVLTSFCSKVKIPSPSEERVWKDNEVILKDQHDTPTTLFNEMVWMPNLEALKVSAIDCEKIWQNQFSAVSPCFQNLTHLIVHRCGNLKFLFSSSVVRSFLKLQHLEIRECPVLKEIIAIEELEEEERKDLVILDQLNLLKIEGLKSLTRFFSKDYIEFPSLIELQIKQCPKFKAFGLENTSTDLTTGEEEGKMSLMPIQPFFNEKVVMNKLEALEVSAINCKKIWQNQLLAASSYFQNLTRLTVQGCGNLKYLFSSSIVRSFLNLQYLEICECPDLTEIIASEELEERERKNIVFPQLNFLKIENLGNLLRFCLEDCIQFPSLKKLQIKKCPKFKEFVLGNVSRHLKTDKEVGKMGLIEIQPFFNDKVAFSDLEEMTFSDLDDLKMIWHNNRLAHNSFGRLKSIQVEGCDNLQILFPPNMFERFLRLESLYVTKCQSLKNIFPGSMARNLLQLKKFEIVGCGLLEEIVASRGGRETSIVRFVFPKVTHLVLQDLPELKIFYPGVYTTEWPVLENLEMSDCEKVKVFASEVCDFQKSSDEDQFDISAQPFFSVQQIFPRLEVLEIRKNIVIICYRKCQFRRHFLRKHSTHGFEAAVLPLCLLEIFYNLNTLMLFDSSYKELFSYEEVEKHTGNFAQIKALHLDTLLNLKHMWKQDSRMNSIFQNLQILSVNFCFSLIELVPSSTSFKNLTTLEVYYCLSMINLVTSSTAKSLKQLREMVIDKCKRMTKVIASEDDIPGDVIVFSKLEKLSLVDLESLTSFCSVKCTFEFPALEELTVTECANMKIFCEGALSTSKLRKVWLNREQYSLEGDLNRTIQQFHNQKDLEVSAIEFEKIWQNQSPTMSSHFQNLKRLIVRGFGNLKYLFPSSIVKSFLQLQYLEICKCTILSEIVASEDLRAEERKDIMFPQLNCLIIKDLDNLTRFYLENYVEFPSLITLEMKQCPKLKAFVMKKMRTCSTVGKEVVKMSSMELQPFFNDKVAFPKLKELVISHLDDLKLICPNNKVAQNFFCELISFTVEGCDKLQTLFPFNMLRRFSKLESLTVNECGSLEEIFGLQGSNFEETYSLRVFELQRMSVAKCQSLKNIFPASSARSLRKLLKLEIIDCRTLKEIVAKEGGKPSAFKFVFPKVDTLVLKNLPALSNFYPGVHISEWPALKQLVVYGCGKAKVFASEFLNFQKTNDESNLDIPTQQPFFLPEKIGRNLELLGLSSQTIMMIWHGQFPVHLFSRLKSLGIKDDESAVFPLGLLENFSNLEHLILLHGSYKELFSYVDVEQHAGNLPRIKSLLLKSLSDMNHLWKQDSKMNSILQNLETLKVEKCHNLVNLVSPSASFQNLTTLKVCYCKGMINLITFSTSKSLERLRKMSIEGCETMTEIVENEENVAEGEIVFNKLEELSLVGLERLSSFCSVKYAFNFPSLYALIVRDCPTMKIFCEGALSTSKLDLVCQNWEDWQLDKGYWGGDLNTTIQQLHYKMNVQDSNEDSGGPSVHHLE